MKLWRNDWCLFAKEVLKANLDKEQQEILMAIQHKPLIAVASGTARGKDFFICGCLSLLLLFNPSI